MSLYSKAHEAYIRVMNETWSSEAKVTVKVSEKLLEELNNKFVFGDNHIVDGVMTFLGVDVCSERCTDNEIAIFTVHLPWGEHKYKAVDDGS